MRRLPLVLIALVLAACGGDVGPGPQPTGAPTPTPLARELAPDVAKSRLGTLPADALAAFAKRDGERLSALAHPRLGVRFTAYPYVDAQRDVVFAAADLRGAFASSKTFTWGAYDGKGDPITLTFAKYVERFVVDVDFGRAPEVAYNRTIGSGNTIDNTAQVYPAAILIEYHFPGFDPMFGGLDWRSLRLLFAEDDGRWYLVGVVHGEWTI